MLRVGRRRRRKAKKDQVVGLNVGRIEPILECSEIGPAPKVADDSPSAAGAAAGPPSTFGRIRVPSDLFPPYSYVFNRAKLSAVEQNDRHVAIVQRAGPHLGAGRVIPHPIPTRARRVLVDRNDLGVGEDGPHALRHVANVRGHDERRTPERPEAELGAAVGGRHGHWVVVRHEKVGVKPAVSAGGGEEAC